jgi:hypothetical protein
MQRIISPIDDNCAANSHASSAINKLLHRREIYLLLRQTLASKPLAIASRDCAADVVKQTRVGVLRVV